MRCQSCGAVIDDNSAFCAVCGTRQDPALARMEAKYGGSASSYESIGSYYSAGSEVGPLYCGVFREPLFLVITILMTVSAVALFVSGVGSDDSSYGAALSAVIPALYAVALWLIYAEFRTDKPLYNTTGLAIASGTTKALCILMWVAVGFVAVSMVLIIFFGYLWVNYLPVPFLEEFPDLTGIPGALGAAYPAANGIPLPNDPRYGAPELDTVIIIMTTIVGIIVIALLIVFNLFFYRKLHRFIKSLCVSLKSDYLQVDHVRAVRAWMIVIAVISFMGSINVAGFYVFGAISSICQGLAAIFASVLIRRHFSNRPY